MKNRVYCSECKEWYETEEVEFIDISEDFSGRDLMTFKCKECNTEQESNVYRR